MNITSASANNHESFTPFEYLQFKKLEIFFRLQEEMRLSREEAHAKFAALIELIDGLKPLRASGLLTVNYLNQAIRELCYADRSFTKNYLLKATNGDITYSFAFNFLAQLSNLYSLFPIELKHIDENELLHLLAQEKVLSVVTNDAEIMGINKIMKPVIKPDSIALVYEILKIHFCTEEWEVLLRILRTGNTPSTKLLFMGSGKTLLDFFKQLMCGQILTVGMQEDLESWIINSFDYLHNRERKGFTPKYANSIISGDARAAKGNRLIDAIAVNGKFEIRQLKLSNRQQD